VNELYELIKKTETLSQILPQTLDRLLALELLHKQGNIALQSVKRNVPSTSDTERFVTVITKAFHSSLF
jgi:hypothetical protein